MADEFEAIDNDFRPETYWPTGFHPVRTEKHPPPVAMMDPSGEIYWDADDHSHYVQYPDEVEIAVTGRTKHHPRYRLGAHHDDDGRIRYRYILQNPEDAGAPMLVVPGITSSAEPLTLGHLLEAIDMTIGIDPDDEDRTATLIERLWQAETHEHGSRGSRKNASQGKTAISPFYPQLDEHNAIMRRRYIEDSELGTTQYLPGETGEEDDVTRPVDLDQMRDILSLAGMLTLTPPASTLDLAFRPETYWPEGSAPLIAEPDAPPVDRTDPNGKVSQDADGRWHTTTFPDEVVLAEMDVEGSASEMRCATGFATAG